MDKGTTQRLYGNYRAQVVENKDKQQFGRVLVWIPDLMESVPNNQGIWARPANNPLGGRNIQSESKDNYYMGSSYIPRKGAWVWVFFEAGNINRPYYFGALDLENTKVLPENQLGANYQDKWTLFKSNAGRAIIISDDPDDERVEITGKKALIGTPPSGDTFSVYRIEQNMNTILIDERDGQEKILIKTRKGDFIHIDVDDRDLEIKFANDFHLEIGGNAYIKVQGDLHEVVGGNRYITTTKETNIFSGQRINLETGDEFNRKIASHSVEQVGGQKITIVDSEIFLDSSGGQNIVGGGNINIVAPIINENSGTPTPTPSVTIDTKLGNAAQPKGDRDT